MNGKSSKRKDLSTFLRILVDLLHHPSGRVCAEQINTWTILLRDPGIASSTIISPFAKEIMMCYMDHNNKIRWEDVENSRHQMTELMEASWDDEDEYESWLCDFRSRCTQLFKSLACIEPQIISSVLYERVHLALQQHGNGAPHDHLYTNNQLTPRSDAVMKLEALIQPVETALSGIPKWAMKDADNHQNRDREAVRLAVTGSLIQLSNAIVTWNPTHIWLKFRRAQLLESMKHFWIHQPTNLLQAVDALLGYLGARDDWSPGHGEPSGEVISLRKKSGVSLVAVAKKVPHHLVLYISPLSEAVRRYLSSSILDPSNRMHLYEFLSCVATAIKDPVIRANFISDVLSDAISVLESPSLKQSMSSLEEFQNWLGISEAANNPSRVSDPEYVQQVTSNFVHVFSAISEILSVGKRCNDAKRRQVGLLPFNVPKGSNYEMNFPDEGPVSLQDLALEDPFVPLWPRILPALLQIIDVLLQLWHPINQAKLLPHNLQRYVYAISDDEAFLSRVHDTKSGGVFGEGGTAGSVVAGVDRRQLNLLPRWSGWFNELRNACFQMLGLLSGQRALFAPELASLYPRFVSIVANPDHFRSMENRQLTQYL
jgi:Exportin-5 family